MEQGTAQVGQFYRVLDPADTEHYRIVLVLHRIDDVTVQTCLVAHDMNGNYNLARTGHDMLIEDSSLDFPILVQTDVVGPVLDEQLVPFDRVYKEGEEYKRENIEKPLNAELVEWAKYTATTGLLPDDIRATLYFGSPWWEITEAHKNWKTEEIYTIHRIASKAMERIFEDLDA